TYDYRISDGGEISDEGHFTTAPGHDGAASGTIPQPPAPFRFLVYGDSRTDHAAHAAVVRQMILTEGSFLVNTGDMVREGKDAADWQTFFDIERALLRDRCVFAAVGNHELTRGDPAGEVAFLRYFGGADDGRDNGRLYGSFRWSNTR